MSGSEDDEITISLINKNTASKTSVAWSYFGQKLVNNKQRSEDKDRWYCSLCFDEDKTFKYVSSVLNIQPMFSSKH